MRRHPADLLSLTSGLLFAAMGLVLVLGGVDTLPLEWIGPLVAIVLGGALILAARSIRADPTDIPSED